MKKWLCIFLAALLGVRLSACTQANAAEDLMKNITPNTVQTKRADDSFALANAEFSWQLLKSGYNADTLMLSPYSVLSALAMTANGADGETLAQFEDAFGLPVQELNAYIGGIDGGEELASGNAIWVREDLPVSEAFLQTNADYYGAAVRRAPFDDAAKDEINAFVKEQTKGRIKKILDQIAPDSALYLVNALAFDAKWMTPYESDDVWQEVFTDASGQSQTVDMLHSEENLYLENAYSVGFCKNYEGGQYCFVALLPNEDLSIQEFLDSMNGEILAETIKKASREKVHATMPKLKIESSLSLVETLQKMGVTDAFDAYEADFSAMSEKPLCIGNVLHKTFLELDEDGTKAAAATVVVATEACMPMEEEPSREVVLNRPYVMGIYDQTNQSFLFLGVVESVN